MTCVAALFVVWPPPASGDSPSGAPARGVWQCSTDTRSHGVRLWWNEKRGSESTVPDTFDRAGVPSYTFPVTDGRCATHPQLVAYLARRIEDLRRRDRVLGLPAPAADTGMPATWGDPSRPDRRVVDGGSPALDVYLDSTRELAEGTATCVRWSPGQERGRSRTAAFVDLHNVRTFNQADLDRLVHNLAHELVHVSQCAVTNRSGTVNGTTIDPRIVEASAEAFAVASSNTIDERLLGPALSRPAAVLALNAASPPSDLMSYAQFPFWYELFGAPSAKRYVGFLRSAVSADTDQRHRSDAQLVYKIFGESAVQRAITRFASFVILGGDMGQAHYDPVVSLIQPADLARLAPTAGSSASASERLATGRYGYITVTWPDSATALTITAEGTTVQRAAESVAVGTRESGVVAPTDGSWTVTRECDPAGRCTGDGRAYISIADGRRSPLALRITAAAG